MGYEDITKKIIGCDYNTMQWALAFWNLSTTQRKEY